MKRLVLNILFFLFPIATFGQSNSRTMMDIGNSIYKPEFLVELIKEKFGPDNSTTMEKIISNHPFLGYGVNKQLVNSPEKLSLFGLPLERAYANYRDGDKFGLYLLLHLDTMKFNTLLEKMGTPENYSLQEIKEGDFDFLAWRHNNILIFLHQTPMVKEDKTIPSEKRYSLFGFSISNAKPGELENDKAVE